MTHKFTKATADFYNRNAESWDTHRQGFWQGWEKLWQLIISLQVEDNSAMRILDLGCGNGRFYDFLAGRVSEKQFLFSYLGVDISEKLIDIAKTKYLNKNANWIVADFNSGHIFTELQKLPKFHFVSLFAVLHHIPTAKAREELIRNAASLVGSGLLGFTIWNFLEDEKLSKKSVAQTPTKTEQVELGDYMISWQANEKRDWRFAHAFAEEELENISKVLSGMGGELVMDYFSDGKSGKLNRYFVWQFR